MTNPNVTKISNRDESAQTDVRAIVYCSFCGKSDSEAEKIIAGPKVFICNECVALCADIISEESKEKHPLMRIINYLQKFRSKDYFDFRFKLFWGVLITLLVLQIAILAKVYAAP